MTLTLHGHDDLYAVEQLQLSLFPEDSGVEAVSSLHRGKTWLTATARITCNGKTATGCRRLPAARETVRARRQALQQSYYLAARQLLETPPPWGALAGVRPTKITTRCLLDGGTPAEADRLLRQVYYVTPQRRALALECSAATVRAAGLTNEKDVSLYIGIPFCPTRCAYCSFVSRTVGQKTGLLEPYLEALLTEMRETAALLANSGRTLRTIYIGGGTPTTLSAPQLERLLGAVRELFDLRRVLEFTVEGGRPDTLDAEKLAAIAGLGVDRMSINPQTMDDRVLRACARPHSAQDVLRAYRQAEQAGFAAINMDLIAGLPGDTRAGFCCSLDAVAALRPANITVHTLALKKDADLFHNRQGLPSAQDVGAMVDASAQTLRALGYRPYYLYRQKYMSGSFENVGWSRDGLDCLYNIYMMEEVHSIIALGGGSVSKLSRPDGTLLRFPNPKFPEQYISMLPSVLDKKRELFAAMEGKDVLSWTP